MPWIPELFSAPILQRILDQRREERLAAVPYFDGLFAGEIDALVGSFAGEPELHHPRRGRVKGARAFAHFVTDTNAGLAARHVEVENVNFIVTPRSGVEEVVLHLDGEGGRFELPMALSAERTEDARIVELRIYYSTRPLTGHHAIRPPLLQPDPDLDVPEVVAAYHRALAAGDVAGAVAAFEPDASVREPRRGPHVHRGTDELEALHERLFSNGGGIELEPCAVTDDGRACALEYNLVAWGQTQLEPQAGLAVYVHGDGGKLAAARIYDNADPPLRVEALATGVR